MSKEGEKEDRGSATPCCDEHSHERSESRLITSTFYIASLFRASFHRSALIAGERLHSHHVEIS